MARGSRRTLGPLAATVLAVGVLGLAGCGEEESHEVEEGEPLELGELAYNVELTRFLNPADPEDAAYLRGQPEARRGESYLGVFMRIENEGDEAAPVSDHMEVLDTRDNRFDLVESESEFALQPDSVVPADGELPAPGTAPSTGPVQGSLVLFLVEDTITENRPVELEISDSSGESGLIELDI
jgi:hypothetical protein